jgi:multiple sugar transport system permease protein
MRHQKKNFSYAKYGYFFVIPFILAFLIFSLYPLIYTIAISFSDMRGAQLGQSFGILTQTLTEDTLVQTNMIRVDASTEPLFDKDGEPVYFKIEAEQVAERDMWGIPIRDENDNVIFDTEYKQTFVVNVQVDEDGKPVRDEDGKVVLDEGGEPWEYEVVLEKIYEYDASGEPVLGEDGKHKYYVEFNDFDEEIGGEAVMNILSRPMLDEYGQPITRLDPLGNYRAVLGMNTFRNALGNTFKIWIINFIPQLLLAIVLAVWFTSRWTKIKGQGIFKMLFYMPNIITAGSIAMLFSTLFMFPIGVINNVMIDLGVFSRPYNFAMDATATQLTVAFIQFWMWYGYTMLIVISGIIGLNPQMYESADIDGAGPVKQFFYITLPNLRTILLFILVTSVIGGLNMFDIPMLFSDGGPGGATRTSSMFIFQQAFAGARRRNTAAAASVIMFFIIAALAIILFFIMRDKDEAKLRKFKREEARAKKQAMKEAG